MQDTNVLCDPYGMRPTSAASKTIWNRVELESAAVDIAPLPVRIDQKLLNARSFSAGRSPAVNRSARIAPERDVRSGFAVCQFQDFGDASYPFVSIGGILERKKSTEQRMRVVGIIAEYNPLHNGHIYHLEQAKALTGATFVVVVMSGSFVQRGEPACTDKYTRAQWVIKAGADLVLELPSVYAVSSAERFALGGVRTLLETRVVTDLAFGCEETDLQTLYQLCDIIVTEPPLFRRALHDHLKQGKSYPRARFDALQSYGVPEYMLAAIAKPNNILAIEYLRALKSYAPSIQPLPIPRVGGGYNTEELTGDYSSATAIRKALASGNRDVLTAMPSFVGGPLLYDPQFPITQADVGDLILYAIRKSTASYLREVPDVDEGFENVMLKAANTTSNIDDFHQAIKSKRYTLARCKRIAINALLGVTADQVHATVRAKNSVYLHVLAVSNAAKQLLSMIGKASDAPLILRNSDVMRAPDITKCNLATDALATDILAYATRNDVHRDSQGPLIL